MWDTPNGGWSWRFSEPLAVSTGTQPCGIPSISTMSTFGDPTHNLQVALVLRIRTKTIERVGLDILLTQQSPQAPLRYLIKDARVSRSLRAAAGFPAGYVNIYILYIHIYIYIHLYTLIHIYIFTYIFCVCVEGTLFGLVERESRRDATHSGVQISISSK